MNLQPGQIIAGKYRIVRQIGQGGMGSVYEGENARIHRRVAIKTLHAQVAGKGDMLQRFEREAQAAGRIGSDHIVEVLDLGDLPDGSRFMVMEFLEGSTLGERIVKQGRIPPRDLVGIMSQLLDGLGAAHAAGIIHRDLKPANVFLLASRAGRPDFVKILDFGVSKFNVMSSDEMSMTRTGAVMGTPYYMSPEQAKGARAIDTRSDLYSIGVIIYEAITGQVPFNAQTFNELIFKIALESPPPPEQFVPNLDPAFGVLMRRAMAREPNERFQTAGELKEALLAWARDFDARAAAAAASPAQPNARLGTQLLPMVTAMQARPVPPTPAATVFAAPPAPLGAGAPAAASAGPGQTQIAHAAPAVAAQPAARRSALPFVLLGGIAVAAAAASVFLVVTGSGNAEAGASTSPPATAAPTSSDSLARAVATATSEPLAATAPSASETAAPSQPASGGSSSAAVAPSTEPTATARPTVARPPPPVTARPTSAPTATAAPTAKSGGRDIRPDL